jgi:TRAP-type C4-dicarboxylate transport system substrate-binding protein
VTTDSPRRRGITRRTLLAAGAALPLCSIITRRASAAEFSYKLATGQDPTHPINIRAQEAIDRIREATGGQLDIRLFPANQLGSDTDLLSQVRMGAVEFFNLSSSIVATLVPQASIVNTGFAFPDYDAVWRAMDGDLGAYVRAEIAKRGIMTASRVWDNGFRHVTTSTRPIHTPEDLRGLKIRVPPAAMLRPRCSETSMRDRRPSTSTNSTRRSRPGWWKLRKTRSPSSRRPGSTRCRNIAA